MSGQELPPYVVGTPLVTLPLCAGSEHPPSPKMTLLAG
jgi:hypothetical protein